MTAPERDTLSPRERAVDTGLAGRGNAGGDDIAFYVEAGVSRRPQSVVGALADVRRQGYADGYLPRGDGKRSLIQEIGT